MKKAELEKENLELKRKIEGMIKRNEQLMLEKVKDEGYQINILSEGGKAIQLFYSFNANEIVKLKEIFKAINKVSTDTTITMYKEINTFPEDEVEEDG